MSTPPLLTAHLLVAGKTAVQAERQQSVRDLIERLREREVRAVVHAHDADPRPLADAGPAVYVSIGRSDADFPALFNMPLFERNRWVHFMDAAAISPSATFHCWLAATDPLPIPRSLPPSRLSAVPLVSVFTAAYRSGSRIQRPYRSLLAQTYENWEWVIMDDSGDDDATYKTCLMPLADKRVRKYRQENRSGYIGTVKRSAAGLCTGEILLELDHDDDLTPDCLQRLVDAFRRNPECGFGFGEAAEVFEETMEPRWYGYDSGFGFLTYWRQHDSVTQRWQSVPRTASLNWKTVRHLVGLPNHPRAWTRDCYFAVGAHRAGLSVGDDYDLLIRSILCTRMLRIQHLVYLQYVNAGGSNQTLQRNAQIQIMCDELGRFYKTRIDARLAELQLPSLDNFPYRRVWTCPDGDPRWRSGEVLDVEDPAKTSYLFVIPFGDAQAVSSNLLDVLRACGERGWRSCEVVVMGNAPEAMLESAAAGAPPGSIRWWRTEDAWPMEECLRYGRMQCTGPERKEYGTTTFETASAVPATPQPLAYTEAFALTAPLDKDRDRLSVLLHLRERFGYKRYLELDCNRDEVFAQMHGFDFKVGVDPATGGTHRLSSDAYFAANWARRKNERDAFDLIFLGSQHDHVKVLRDVNNALAFLQPGGTIVLHNCMPATESQQIVPRPQPLSFWTGDVWKAVFALRQRPDVEVAVGRFDWGVGVLRVRANSRPFNSIAGSPASWAWNHYSTHRDAGLNAMGYDALVRWVEAGMVT